MDGTPTRRNSDLRRRNSLEVLDLLRRNGRLSRSELTRHTTLSPQAVATILNELVESGQALEVGARGASRGRGRPALLYEYNPDQFSVVALYVGLRYSELSICDGLGRAIAANVTFHPGWDVETIVSETSHHVGELRRAARVEHRPTYLGVVVHGSVDAETGATDSRDMGWHRVPLAELLEAEVGAPVTVHDASRAAAIAECREGVALGVRRVLVLNIGPEITATQIIDGVPDLGATGLAGMVGRALIWEDGVTKRLEDVAGSFAVKQRYADVSGISVDWMSEVWERARDGDADAEATMAVHLDAVAHAAMWLITIANPERFVVTGAGGALLDRWRARLHSTIVELTDPRLLRDCTIRFTDLGQEAWIRGGVHAVLDHRQRVELDDPAEPRSSRAEVRPPG